jgi:ABC-type uncharacterized transport system permease subunit
MDRFNDLNLWWLWLAAVAAGAVAGGLTAAVNCLLDWARGRRT